MRAYVAQLCAAAGWLAAAVKLHVDDRRVQVAWRTLDPSLAAALTYALPAMTCSSACCIHCSATLPISVLCRSTCMCSLIVKHTAQCQERQLQGWPAAGVPSLPDNHTERS